MNATTLGTRARTHQPYATLFSEGIELLRHVRTTVR